MALVSLRQLLDHAAEHTYALPAFNVNNMEQMLAIMAAADEMIRSYGFILPPFAYWSPEEFKACRDVAKMVIEAQCGWDITDYGLDRFDELGLFLFTLRNGRLADLRRGGGGP